MLSRRMVKNRVDRVRAAAAVAAASSLVATGCAAGGGETTGTNGAKNVTFQLNWVPAGNHAPFYLAKQAGYWNSCGLNVSIRRGKGSGDTTKVVGTGAAEFGFADAAAVAPGRVQGLPVVSLGVLYQKNPSAIVARQNSGIKKLEDIERKTFGAVPGGSPYLLYKWVVGKNNINVDSIREVSVSAPGIAQLKTGQVNFITYFANEVAKIYPNPEAKLTVLPFAEYGLNVYGLSLVTNQKMLKSDPDAVRCFVDGVMKGLKTARNNPSKALDALYKGAPETAGSPGVQKQLLAGVWSYTGEDLLAQNAEGWSRTQETLKEANVIKGSVIDPNKFFTNKFVE